PNQAPTASFTFSPSSPTTGTTVSFNASASTDPDGSIVAYTWNFGDGVTGSGVTASHAYAVAGSYTVSLTVRDDDSATNSTTRTVTVQTPLVADLTVASLTYSPSAPVLGQSITFTVAVVNQGSAGAGQFRVLLDSGTSSTFVYVPQLGAGAGQSLTMTLPLASSSQTFTARADDLGQIAEASESNNTRSVTISAGTPPPTAEAGGPYTGTAGAPIAFNGYGSGGSITTYSWSFGDGTSAQGVAPSHAYSVPGTYTATLTVFGPGGQSSDSASVSVTAAQPALNATVALSKATYMIGESISITLTTNRTAYLYVCEVRADQRVLLIYPNRYQPNNRLQPGTMVLPGSGYSLRAAEPAGNETLYLFAATVPIPGFPTSFGSDFPVLSTSPTAFRDSVRATMASLVPDDDRVFRSTGFTIVAAPPTTGTLRVVTTPAGATVRLDGTSIGTSPLERTNIPTGQHTVQLSLAGYEVETRQVSIQAGATTNLTVTLTPLVTNQPPTASFSFSPASVAAGQTVVFNATASSDPDGAIASYAWTFGDGATATGSSPSHAYADAGSFTVTLTVRDDGGLSRSTSKTLAVTDDPAWVVLLLPAALAADWTDHALALDGDPKTGAIGPATRSQWTSYLFFDAPGGGIQCDGLRFRSTFAPPSVISAPGGRGGEPYVLKLSWQVSVRTETGWKLVYEGALAQGEWADVRFDTVAVTEIRFRARGDLRNTLDPKLLEVHLHDASL
ncbi:MAG: PKD domain-containing protein, partial [Candidatus Bipolaricaulis sp.]|nr:PKD domain-containing protein [Candidatus Bipolaricaulis sp.]